MTRQIDSVAVLGCGTMGSGIGAASAAAGCRVLMLDVTSEAAAKGAGPVAFEEPYKFRARMRKLSKWMRKKGTYPTTSRSRK